MSGSRGRPTSCPLRTVVQVRCSVTQRQRWEGLCALRGRDLSAIVRELLDAECEAAERRFSPLSV